MRRGEIRLVDLEPALGQEASRRRPAVVVSNDRANAAAVRTGRGVATVVPVTGDVARIHPFQTLLPAAETGLRADSKAEAEQVRAVAIARPGGVLGRLTPALSDELDRALRVHLQL